jgi:hypothetical protein
MTFLEIVYPSAGLSPLGGTKNMWILWNSIEPFMINTSRKAGFWHPLMWMRLPWFRCFLSRRFGGVLTSANRRGAYLRRIILLRCAPDVSSHGVRVFVPKKRTGTNSGKGQASGGLQSPALGEGEAAGGEAVLDRVGAAGLAAALSGVRLFSPEQTLLIPLAWGSGFLSGAIKQH